MPYWRDTRGAVPVLVYRRAYVCVDKNDECDESLFVPWGAEELEGVGDGQSSARTGNPSLHWHGDAEERVTRAVFAWRRLEESRDSSGALRVAGGADGVAEVAQESGLHAEKVSTRLRSASVLSHKQCRALRRRAGARRYIWPLADCR